SATFSPRTFWTAEVQQSGRGWKVTALRAQVVKTINCCQEFGGTNNRVIAVIGRKIQSSNWAKITIVVL
ncbi:MAG TPA: hypothetical protein VKD65_15900, partial [Candidatus Angelobacter sp.]|nr:hypothetical protein [Candidatus Angelobacter sp.]